MASTAAETNVITAISVIKNEADVIETMVRHNLRYVDRIHFIDNGSTDATRDILTALQGEGLPVEFEIDARLGHHQHTFMTRLANQTYPTDSLMPLDADEFLMGEPETFKALALERQPISIPWRTYVPRPEDNWDEPNLLKRIQHRRAREEFQEFKAFIPRAIPRPVRIETGSHRILDASSKLIESTTSNAIALAHMPVRSIAHFSAKLLVGNWNMRLRRRGRLECNHWHRMVQPLLKGEGLSHSDLQRCALTYSHTDDSDPKDTDLLHDPLEPQPLKYTRTDFDLVNHLISFAEQLVKKHEIPDGNTEAAPSPIDDFEGLIRHTPKAALLPYLKKVATTDINKLAVSFHQAPVVDKEFYKLEDLTRNDIDTLLFMCAAVLSCSDLYKAYSGVVAACRLRVLVEHLKVIANRRVKYQGVDAPQKSLQALCLQDETPGLLPDQLVIWAVFSLIDDRNYLIPVLERKRRALSLLCEHGVSSIIARNWSDKLKLHTLCTLNTHLTHLEGWGAGLDEIQNDIKSIRPLVVEALEALGKNERALKAAAPIKNRVVVFLEKADRPGNAIATCFAPLINGLAGLDVHLVSTDTITGFEGFTRHQIGGTFASVADTIKDLRPEILILYSAVLTDYASRLATGNFAPKQYALAGYPVETAFSTTRQVMRRAEVTDTPPASTTILEQPLSYSPLPEEIIPKVPATMRDKALIGCPANIYKITPLYLDALKKVCESGAETRLFGRDTALKKAAFERITGIQYEPGQPLRDYLARVAECDFLAAPFPFASLVALVHALQIGVPTLLVKGSHPNSRAGAAVLTQAGLSDFVCSSVADYEERLVAYAAPKFRKALFVRRNEIITMAGALFMKQDGTLKDLLTA